MALTVAAREVSVCCNYLVMTLRFHGDRLILRIQNDVRGLEIYSQLLVLDTWLCNCPFIFVSFLSSLCPDTLLDSGSGIDLLADFMLTGSAKNVAAARPSSPLTPDTE